MMKNFEIVLTLIHGSKEHWNRYKIFIKEIESNGIKVVAGDLATHGEKFYGENHNFTFDEMLDSALHLVNKAREKYPEAKHFIMGHSMGSFITKYIVYKNLEKFDGVILSGTNNTPKWLVNLAMAATNRSFNKVSKVNEWISYGLPSLSSKIKGKGSNWLSTDPFNQKSFEQDPLCGNDFTNGSLHAIYKFIKEAGLDSTLNDFKDKKIHQLLIYGEDDPLTNFGADIKSLIKKQNKYGIYNHRVISYPNCKHEIVFDNCKDMVANDIINFIKEKAA